MLIKPIIGPVVNMPPHRIVDSIVNAVSSGSSPPPPSSTPAPSPTPTPTPIPVNPIEALFANGENGAWYDPSDLSTLFQESNGITPVTGSGQPVGLMLDKSKGLVRGPNAGDGPITMTGAWVDNGDGSFTKGFGSGIAWFGDPNDFPNYSFMEVSVVVDSIIGGLSVIAKGTNIGYITAPGSYHWLTLGAASGATALSFQADTDGTECVIRDVYAAHVPGHHLTTQNGPTTRPIYWEDAGIHYLEFDGIDDDLRCPMTMAWGSDEVSTLVGVDLFGEYTNNVRPILGFGFVYSSWVDGTWQLNYPFRPGVGNNRVFVQSRGTSTGQSLVLYPDDTDVTDVIWGESKISTDEITATSVAGTIFPQSLDQGTGDFGTNSIRMGEALGEYIGMNLYGAVARNTLSTMDEQQDATDWMISKTGL